MQFYSIFRKKIARRETGKFGFPLLKIGLYKVHASLYKNNLIKCFATKIPLAFTVCVQVANQALANN